MSDLFKTREKVEAGANWRGSINVVIDGEEMELSVRQLNDIEFYEVMNLVDTDEIEDLQDHLPKEKMEEISELQEKDSLDDAESERLDALQEELEDQDVNIFDVLSLDTFKGIRKAAKYGVEPDEADKRDALSEYGGEIKEQYGRATSENAGKWLNAHMIEPMIEDATDFASFSIGVKVLTESLDDEGN